MKDDCELSYLLMASLFWVENEQETGYESFVRQYIPQIFTKLLAEEHCRHWQPEVNQAIQRRNLELIRLVASMLKNNVYNSSLTPVMCGLLDPDCFFFVKNKHGNPPSYNSGKIQPIRFCLWFKVRRVSKSYKITVLKTGNFISF